MSLHLSHILSHCIPIESLYPITSPFFLFMFVGKIPHFVKAPHLVIVLGLVVVLSFFFQFLSHFLTTSAKNKAQHAPNPWCYSEGKSKMAMETPINGGFNGKIIYSCFSLHFKGTVGMFVHHLDLSSCLSVLFTIF